MNADDVAFLIVHDRPSNWREAAPEGKSDAALEIAGFGAVQNRGRWNNRVQAPSVEPLWLTTS